MNFKFLEYFLRVNISDKITIIQRLEEEELKTLGEVLEEAKNCVYMLRTDRS